MIDGALNLDSTTGATPVINCRYAELPPVPEDRLHLQCYWRDVDEIVSVTKCIDCLHRVPLKKPRSK